MVETPVASTITSGSLTPHHLGSYATFSHLKKHQTYLFGHTVGPQNTIGAKKRHIFFIIPNKQFRYSGKNLDEKIVIDERFADL